MFRKNKENESLVKASRKSLREAEDRMEGQNLIITDLKAENIELYQENKDLRSENEELRFYLQEIETELKKQQYGSINNLKNKIKSILMTAKSI